MSKYDEYLKRKPEVERVVRYIRLARGQDAKGNYDSNNDKATFQFQAGMNRTNPKLLDAAWTPAMILLELSYGYYGSSSGYSAMDELTAGYVMKACNALKGQIAEKAIALAIADLEACRLAAQDEAQSVMNGVAHADLP